MRNDKPLIRLVIIVVKGGGYAIMKTETRKVYIASDGNEFLKLEEANEYEEKLKLCNMEKEILNELKKIKVYDMRDVAKDIAEHRHRYLEILKSDELESTLTKDFDMDIHACKSCEKRYLGSLSGPCLRCVLYGPSEYKK